MVHENARTPAAAGQLQVECLHDDFTADDAPCCVRRRLARKGEGRIARACCLRGRRTRRPRVKEAVLCAPEIWPGEAEEIAKARALISSAVAAAPEVEAEAEAEAKAAKEAATERTPWEDLLERARRSCAEQIVDELGEGTKISPVYPMMDVQHRFLHVCSRRSHALSYGYHGTPYSNIDSIVRRGLIVPGHKGVAISNGSAHGVGVYTARLGKAAVSQRYTRGGSRLFVCAICDTSDPVTEDDTLDKPWKPSSTHIMSQSEFPMKRRQFFHEVLHVGDAIVVFKERFVVPIFVVEPLPAKLQSSMPEREEWEPPQQIRRRQLAVPSEGDPGIRFGGPGVRRAGQTVWLPQAHSEGATRHALALRRRREHRHMAIERRAAHYVKWHR
eukprot:NODE_4226_length_1918_cov_11.499162.p1 GENE.NODE_4226_length_1918_cov_11.499162~~NODE_4226_length_1918_cov_11.499162.p1  ORF type:complete len:387 (-),score=57.50 NODE_4226_length_1918_cov_11.499162:516-1676(-)